MGGYIRMDKDLDEDPRVDELSKALAKQLPELIRGLTAEQLVGLAHVTVLGALYRLWRYGDTYLGRHNRLKGALHGPARIEEVTALPALLVEKFPREWLRIHPDGSIELPDYAAKNNLIDRDMRREKGRERVRRHREKKRREPLESNASQTVTDEALHRYKSVTTGTGTGPGPEPYPPEPGPDPSPSASRPAAQGAAAPRKSFQDDFRQRFGGEPRSAKPPDT